MPNWNHIVREHLAVLRLPPEREIEIIEEQALHLEAAYEDALAAGLSEAEAEARAMRSYDWRLLECELSRAEQPLATRTLQPSLELIERQGGTRMESFIQDLRFGVRMLLKNPGFTLIAVLTLALGIGANTAIFSFVQAVLLRPLPYPDPERLVFVFETEPELPKAPVTGPDYLDWKGASTSFEVMAAGTEGSADLTGAGDPRRINAVPVTAGFFDVMRVMPMLGRSFAAADEQPGHDAVAILTHGLWQTQFGADANVIGKQITLSGQSVEVIGVLPPHFTFPPIWGLKPELFIPLTVSRDEQTRGSHWLWVMARLKAGVSHKQAQTEMENLAARLAKQYPGTNHDIGAAVVGMQEYLVGDTKSALLVLLGVVVFALLIASANIANLFLARVVSRQREMALRVALGASRFRLLRQLLTESVLLSLLGGAVGLFLAVWTIKTLTAFTPATYLPQTGRVELNLSVLLFTLGVAVLTGVLCGLAPAWQAARVNLNDSLKEGAAHLSGARRGNSFRRILVVAEIALGLALVMGAGLMMRSLQKLLDVNPGFVPANVTAMELELPRSRYGSPQQVGAFFESLVRRAQALPGVEAATAASQLPLSGGPNGGIQIEGRPQAIGTSGPLVQPTSVFPDYFRALSIPLLRGRAFQDSDAATSAKVVIINQTLARRFWPNEDPLGKRLSYGAGNVPDWHEVIGVVGDVHQWKLTREPLPEVFFAHAQRPLSSMHLLVRSATDPGALARSLRRQVRELDPELPINSSVSLDSILGRATHVSRFQTLLMGSFGTLALLLVLVGIYGVMSYTVAQHTHEIGIRLALGAQKRDVLRLVVGQGMVLALAGVVLGLLCALALTRLLKTLLFGLSPTDPLTFACVTALLLAMALLACWIPARRATKVDPLEALRSE